MKADDIYNKALAEYPIKEKLNEKAVGTYDANYPRRKAFIAGAEWMQEKMQETNEGQALLYAVEKTAERTKREVIEKVAEWMRNFKDGQGNFPLYDYVGNLKQAMQDESK